LDAILEIFPWLPYLFLFVAILGLIAVISIPFLLVSIKRQLNELNRSLEELAARTESIFIKASPILDAGVDALSKTKECPDCKKLIDGAYGACPFCGHEFSKKYFVNIIGPADELALNNTAKRLAQLLKIDFHEVKHRLKMGFDYAAPDHTKRMELMSGLEKMGCTVREVVKWV
jgi:RNA polymerase subunit RPABC4/transcription elongation factor Spt4